jgi:hypothetical protein
MKKNLFPSERGQAMILIVLSIVGLIGITALAVDGGLYYADRRQAQNAADSAVLAASLARLRGDDYQAVALARAQQNGYDNDGVKSSIEVHVPPVSGPYEGNSEYIQVVVTSHYNTYFGSVVGVDELTNSVEAIARAKPPEVGPILPGYAVVSLAPYSDCKDKRSFWAHGESTLELYGGGVFINSDHPTCAFMQEGSASLVFADTNPFNIVGGASIQKVQLIKRLFAQAVPTPGEGESLDSQPALAFLPSTGSSPMPYPPPFVMPKPRCGTKIAEVDSLDPSIMSPGNWEEDFPPKGVTKLKPGIYCINGDVRIGKDTETELTGQGVLLFVEHGSAHFSSTANITLEASNKGPFKGLLLFLPMDNHSLVVLNGSAESIFRGTILAPGSKIRIIGNESRYGYHSQIIGYTIELDGNSKILIRYLDDQNYDALVSPEIQFGQ